MSFKQKLTSGVKRHLGNLKKAYDNRVAIAEAKARRDLAKAQTKSQREQAMLKLKREKMRAKQDLYEARIATQKAKRSLEKARKEAGDLSIGERLFNTYKAFTKTKKRVTRHTRRKTRR